MMIKRTCCAVSLLLAMSGAISTSAWAADASPEVSISATSLVLSPLLSVVGVTMDSGAFFIAGSALMVVGISEVSGGMLHVVVQNTVDGSKAVFQTAASVGYAAGISVGTGIQLIAESTGHSLVASGKILAFIPNAIGQALLHQTKLSG